MNQHYYQFMYQIKINNGHADCDTQLYFDDKLEPKDFNQVRKYLMELNKELDPVSIVFRSIFYIGLFESKEDKK